MGRIKLGYWNIRALAEPIRYALEYCGEDYEEKLYLTGPGPGIDRAEWLEDKWKLGLDFPNLPYLMDGEEKVTESMAVLKYVCRKHGLMPKPGAETTRADMVEGVLLDYKNAFYMHLFASESEFEKAKEGFQKKSREVLSQIEKFVGQNRWLLSDEIRYLDFFLATYLKQMVCMYPHGLDFSARLQKYISDFDSLPKIKAYLSSGRFKKYPVTGPITRWGFTETT